MKSKTDRTDVFIRIFFLGLLALSVTIFLTIYPRLDSIYQQLNQRPSVLLNLVSVVSMIVMLFVGISPIKLFPNNPQKKLAASVVGGAVLFLLVLATIAIPIYRLTLSLE